MQIDKISAISSRNKYVKEYYNVSVNQYTFSSLSRVPSVKQSPIASQRDTTDCSSILALIRDWWITSYLDRRALITNTFVLLLYITCNPHSLGVDHYYTLFVLDVIVIVIKGRSDIILFPINPHKYAKNHGDT